jgi:Na+/proline symporter
MSSLDSSMNSLSTVSVNDFFRRFINDVTDRTALNVARVLTLIFGTFGTLTALYIATVKPLTMFNLFIQLLSVVGSGLAGMFVLGVCVKRANGAGAVIGAATSALLMCLVQPNARGFIDRHLPFTIPFEINVHSFGHAIIGFVTCFVVGTLASFIVGGRPRAV